MNDSEKLDLILKEVAALKNAVTFLSGRIEDNERPYTGPFTAQQLYDVIPWGDERPKVYSGSGQWRAVNKALKSRPDRARMHRKRWWLDLRYVHANHLSIGEEIVYLPYRAMWVVSARRKKR